MARGQLCAGLTVAIPADGTYLVRVIASDAPSNPIEQTLTGELVSMITAQRVYQANAQTIKTQDQVLQTLVNLR